MSHIPRRYSSENLVSQKDSIDWENSQVEKSVFDADLDRVDNHDIQLFYGKALYPGYFEADDYILDDRFGRVPPPGKSRVVFNLAGMENIWVSLPISAVPGSFPHGADVVVLGEITRDSPEYLQQKLHPYFQAKKVYIFDSNEGTTINLLGGSKEN